MILDAQDYVPYAQKEEWVGKYAQNCFDRLAITADGEEMPPMYAVNVGLKNRYLMGALAHYLGVGYKTEADSEELMSVEDYDKWAGSHVMNQLDRLKKDAEIRDKCYDILYDFRELEKLLSAQIYGLLTVQNDSVIRQSQQMANSVRELPQILEQLKELQEKQEVVTDAE